VVSFRVFTLELPPYVKNDKISSVKLVARDVICGSTVIPKVSLARLLIPRVAVV
jgi:hypothetical protein